MGCQWFLKHGGGIWGANDFKTWGGIWDVNDFKNMGRNMGWIPYQKHGAEHGASI